MKNFRMPDPRLNAPGKGRAVREMFAEIAPTYDRVNRIISINIDTHWRDFTVGKLEDVLARPGAIALDLCCGTADLTLQLQKQVRVIGCDFCHPMLVLGNKKLGAGRIGNTLLTEGDALRLPFADYSFDAVTIAFGLRNLENIEAGLLEIFRVLKPGGRAAILEFARPVIPVFRQIFEFYIHRILPRIGGIISGSRSAYTYLPKSVGNFPDQKKICAMMRAAGYSNVCYHNLLSGVAAVYLGERKL